MAITKQYSWNTNEGKLELYSNGSLKLCEDDTEKAIVIKNSQIKDFPNLSAGKVEEVCRQYRTVIIKDDDEKLLCVLFCRAMVVEEKASDGRIEKALFEFNNFQHQVVRPFSADAPPYRIAVEGINL